jgi:hypothetical protein
VVPWEEWTVLDGLTFLPADLATITTQSIELVTRVLSAFTLAAGNPTFTSLHEFNATNAYPLLTLPDGRYLLFQYATLTEAIYDTPFYWMSADKAYATSAMANRGVFTEEFAAERLERVFSKTHVFRNVDVWKSKGEKLGEIDTLGLYGNRAIVLQAKSKKLTLDSRKGNDLQLKADFKAAVQDACDQAFVCSQELTSQSVRLTDASGQEIPVPASFAAIHPVCLVAEHYPALSFQAREFLRHSASGAIKVPLVCDVFLLDTMTEMLETPLRLLSYLELRSLAGDNVMLSHENVALAYHLKQNLWLGEYDMLQLADDISTDLDIAMAARRDGVDGKRTPPGILTELRELAVQRIISEIEKRSDAAAVEIGLELLKLSGETATNVSYAINKMASLSAKDGKGHDATFGFRKAGLGLTVHCNALADSIAAPKLRAHCELRKYGQKAGKWLGLIITPGDGHPRLGLVLDYPWVADDEMDKLVAQMPPGLTPVALRPLYRDLARPGKKLGKYQRCPCGSMMKFIKCCLRRRKKLRQIKEGTSGELDRALLAPSPR